MAEEYQDKQTGWHVRRERTRGDDGQEMDQLTLTDPETGERLELLVNTGFPPEYITEHITYHIEDRLSLERIEADREAWVRERYPELAAGKDAPDGPLGKIKLVFARMYAHCRVALPDDLVAERRPGRVPNRMGLLVEFNFGSDEKGEYMDFFASHRMTNDRLYRIYEDGTSEMLGASWDLFASYDEETRAREREFYELVKKHGFMKE